MIAKLSPRRSSIVIILGLTILSACAEFLGCDQMPPIDEHFDSSLGADFEAPAQDAGADTGAGAASEVGTP